MTTDDSIPEARIDADDLYLEEVFTDRRVGSLRRLTPVTADGAPDPGRPVQFSGQTQLLTPMGAVPLVFDIEAATLSEAIERFPAAMREAVERTVEEVKELRRQAASSIVLPDMASGGGIAGPGGFGGGFPGGGKIQIP